MTQCQTSLCYNLLLSDSAVGVAGGELHYPVSHPHGIICCCLTVLWAWPAESFMTQCQTSSWYNLLLSDSAVEEEVHDPVSDILMA